MKIRAKKIGKGSLFKIILICQVVPFGILFLICGIAAAFGAETVTLNGVAKTGISGLITAAFLYLAFMFVITCLCWICAALGLWSYSWFQDIEIEFKDGQVIRD